MPRSFAIIPAAGRSVRMGEPKLLLPWKDRTIIEQVVAAWQTSGVDAVLVAVHPDDTELAETCRRAGAEVVVADQPPPDMKASVGLGLTAISERHSPESTDAWLVAPADIPELSSVVIDRLLDEHRSGAPSILIPVFDGKHGHPVLFPWDLAEEVSSLAEDQGIKHLFEQHPLREIPCSADSLAGDIDTPEDYRNRRNRNDRT